MQRVKQADGRIHAVDSQTQAKSELRRGGEEHPAAGNAERLKYKSTPRIRPSRSAGRMPPRCPEWNRFCYAKRLHRPSPDILACDALPLKFKTKESPMRIAAILFAIFTLAPWATFAADDTDRAKQETGTLLFEDDFQRDEPTPDKEDIGGGWSSNSAWRAKGHKQVDLEGGAMHVTRHAEADHGVAIFHQAAFADGVVEMKFKLGPDDDLGLDFVDRDLKTVHAGHLCMARVTLKNLRLTDSKTGHMDNAIRERRLAGEKSAELTKLLQSKSATFPLKLEADEWHTLRVVVSGDEMQAMIDGRLVGEFKSEGIAHPTKKMITLAVNKSAWIDDVKVWKRK